ncbi:MAG: DUF4405 domain-containing protein, partial [Phycisphaeraceae bacterium]|nr:DUF4405 domain-containing protein [Phycisphaeraceae bacterium]
SKHQWGGLHVWFSLLFVVICIVHVFFNWKVLLNYFKDQSREHLALTWEWSLSLL